MATIASTPSRSTIPPPWLGISPRRPGTPPAQGPLASSGFPRACPSPTSTPPLGLGLTAFMTTASALCWAWAAAPSSSVSVSSSAAHWATPVHLSTRSATAAWAATVNRKATCSLTKTARLRPRPPPTTLSPPHRTQTSRGRSRSVCRPTSDRQWETRIEQDVQTAIGLWDWSSSDERDVTLCSEHLETWGPLAWVKLCDFMSQKSNWEALFFSPNNPLMSFPFFGKLNPRSLTQSVSTSWNFISGICSLTAGGRNTVVAAGQSTRQRLCLGPLDDFCFQTVMVIGILCPDIPLEINVLLMPQLIIPPAPSLQTLDAKLSCLNWSPV